MPSLVEVGSLLFANAAAAYATPFALSGTSANVLAVRIAALVSGDIFSNPGLSSLLALLMFALLAVVIGGANSDRTPPARARRMKRPLFSWSRSRSRWWCCWPSCRRWRC